MKKGKERKEKKIRSAFTDWSNFCCCIFCFLSSALWHRPPRFCVCISLDIKEFFFWHRLFTLKDFFPMSYLLTCQPSCAFQWGTWNNLTFYKLPTVFWDKSLCFDVLRAVLFFQCVLSFFLTLTVISDSLQILFT